jgi:hypothetical protein
MNRRVSPAISVSSSTTARALRSGFRLHDATEVELFSFRYLFSAGKRIHGYKRLARAMPDLKIVFRSNCLSHASLVSKVLNTILDVRARQSSPKSRDAMLQYQHRRFQKLLHHVWSRFGFLSGLLYGQRHQRKGPCRDSIGDLQKTLVDNAGY